MIQVKKIVAVLAVLVFMLGLMAVEAEAKKNVRTPRAGIQALERDFDGDGIPNCIDDDWVRLRCGNSNGNGNGGQNGDLNQFRWNWRDQNFYNYNYFYNYNWGGQNGSGVYDGTGRLGRQNGRL